MRPRFSALALACLGLSSLACGTDAKKTGAKPEALEPEIDDHKIGDPDADRPEEDAVQASFAKPTAEPPPAPEGAITLADPWLYVQTCAEPHPCPSLKQPAGDAHCRELVLGGHDVWRLPSKDEVLRLKGVEGLEATAGYHWTRTPFEENLGQVWIVDFEDPEAAPATTIPRERKEFRIRCVKEP
jgi:hypothetical protein